jgi:predicted dithiol-disulfide oxidoreductase (DUF899 family)
MPTKSETNLQKQLEKASRELRKTRQKINSLRRKLPPMEVEDYTLKKPDGKPVTLSALFGKKDELLLIHNMGKECPYCTLWSDGFNGVYKHFENRAAFVVASPNTPAAVKKSAASRGWKFKMVSHRGTTFGRDMGFESDKGSPWPGVSTFRKDKDGRIFRVASDFFGPGDDYCALWHLFELLPNGINDWQPKYKYR